MKGHRAPREAVVAVRIKRMVGGGEGEKMLTVRDVAQRNWKRW